MAPTFWSSLESGATLLTANARLAGWLRGAYDQRQQAAGRRAWATPEIHALDAWLERLWTPTGATLRLSGAQEQLLWEEIIGGSAAAAEVGALLDVAGTARTAAAAWRLAQGWRLEWTDAAWEQSADTAAFRGWARALARRCQEAGWITAAELPDAVGALARRGNIAVPGQVWLAGFDELTPQQQELLAALRGAGSAVETVEVARMPAALRLAAAHDTEEEIRLAAEWARGWLEPRTERGNAGAVGIIVPELQAERATVERIFTEVLHPGRAPWSEQPRAFNLSLGLPLSHYPVVAAALQWLAALSAGAAGLEIGELGALLRTPFMDGAETEGARRAGWEARLRRELRSQIRWKELQAQADACPRWTAAVRRARAARARWPRRQSHGGWAAGFAQMLEMLGWPGERPLGSDEFQTVEAWDRALEELGRLDQVAAEAVTEGTALRRLGQIAAMRTFQPRAAAAPVQIMGWLEAAGLEFEHLWVTGLHDGVLPGTAAPHPFIPLRWQRERGMPHASAGREAAFTAQILRRLRQSTPDLVTSYPQHQQEVELRPSPLLAGAEAWAEAWARLPLEPTAVEELADARAPTATAEEPLHGGSRIFAEQAACPFRAFAHMRLHAQAIEPAPAGLAPSTRGTLLHAVLEQVWAQLRTQAELLALTPEALSGLVAERAAAVVATAPLLQARPGLAALERERLTRLTLAWLEREKERPVAFRVIGREEEREAEFGGLPLRLRLDRVDELENGGRVLIDYKSGTTSKGDWAPPRPWEPQLPLYLATDPAAGSVAAISFAQLAPGAMSFKATARRRNILPRAHVPESWGEQTEAWQQALQELAGDFLAGRAAVDPKLPRMKSCGRCDLGLLCRIEEAELDRRLEEWDADGEGAEDAD